MYKINLRDNYMCNVTPNHKWHVPKMVFSMSSYGWWETYEGGDCLGCGWLLI